MYKEKFNELWEKTINGVLYGISAKDIKGKKQLNEYLKSFVWEHSWGNKKMVPPERKLLEDIRKESPQKAKEMEELICNISVGYGTGFYAGIVTAVLGIILLFVTPAAKTALKVLSGVICIGGIGISFVDVMQCNYNPKKVALGILAKIKEKGDSILS